MQEHKRHLLRGWARFSFSGCSEEGDPAAHVWQGRGLSQAVAEAMSRLGHDKRCSNARHWNPQAEAAFLLPAFLIKQVFPLTERGSVPNKRRMRTAPGESGIILTEASPSAEAPVPPGSTLTIPAAIMHWPLPSAKYCTSTKILPMLFTHSQPFLPPPATP